MVCRLAGGLGLELGGEHHVVAVAGLCGDLSVSLNGPTPVSGRGLICRSCV